MIAVGTLFLLGTALVSGSVIRESYPYPPAIAHEEYGLPIQVSGNGAFISVDHTNCEHSNQINFAPLPLPELRPLSPIVGEVKESIIIPEAPQLGPFVIPEFPIRVAEPHEILYVPEAPKPIVIEEPLYIPEAPALPPWTLPELPVKPIFVAPYPAATIELTHENCGHILPSAPELPPVVPNEIEVLKETIAIPEAPELGPILLPEFPVRGDIPEPVVLAPYPAATNVPEAPILEPLVLPELPIRVNVIESAGLEKEDCKHGPFIELPAPEHVIIEAPKAPVVIPAAPELGPLVLPEFPVRVEVPKSPVIFEEPKAPVFIPEAPELRPFVWSEFPVRVEVPELPTLITEKEPCIHSTVIEVPSQSPVIIEEPKASIIIPEAPELGPFVLPEFPVRVEVPESPVIIEEPITPVVIPEAPKLGPFLLPEFPVRFEVPKLPTYFPEAPVLSPLVLPDIPTNVITVVPEAPRLAEPCVHDIVGIPAAPELPHLTAYIPAIESNYISGPPAETYGLPL